MIEIKTEHVTVSVPERESKFETLYEHMDVAFNVLDIESAISNNGVLGVHSCTQICVQGNKDVQYAEHAFGHFVAVWIYKENPTDEDKDFMQIVAHDVLRFNSHCERVFPIILTENSLKCVLDIAQEIRELFENDQMLGISPNVRVF
jgi:hypothetical protein